MIYEEFLDIDGNTILKIKLLKAQRTWVGLTDDEITEIHRESGGLVLNSWDYERAIEKALREKNK